MTPQPNKSEMVTQVRRLKDEPASGGHGLFGPAMHSGSSPRRTLASLLHLRDISAVASQAADAPLRHVS